MQVNTNGVISFLDQVSQYTPDSFPLGDNRRLVAPFWADVDTRVAGQVFYRETTDQGLLQQASEDVQANFVDHSKFKPTWLFISTWHEVAFYGAEGSYKNKVWKIVQNDICFLFLIALSSYCFFLEKHFPSSSYFKWKTFFCDF